MDAAVNLGGRAADRSRQLRGDAGLDPPQSARPLGRRRRSVRDQSVRASLSRGDVSRDRPVERPELLAVGGLYVCRRARSGKSPAKPRRPLATIRLPAASRARFWASRSFASPVSCWSALTMGPACGEHWPRCSPPRRPASITPCGRSRGIARARRRAVLRHPRPVRRNRDCTGRSRSVSSLALNQPRLALSMDYGYPGNASYRHERPFDYFRIESSVSSEGLEQLSTRGLIAGADYGAGASRRHLGPLWHATTTSRQTTFASPARRSRSARRCRHRYPSRWWCRVPGLWEGATPPRIQLRPDGRARLPLRCRSAGARKPAIDRRAPGRSGSDRAGVLHQRRRRVRHRPARSHLRREMPRSPSVSIGRHALGLTYQLAGRSSDYLDAAGPDAGAVDGRRLLHVPRFRRLRRGAVGLSSHRKDAETQGRIMKNN